MTAFAYVRVSTSEQDNDAQLHGLLQYANAHDLGKIQIVRDTASGTTPWARRALGPLLKSSIKPGDTLLFSEISRIARSTIQVLDVLKTAAEREARVIITKQNMIIDGSINSKIIVTMLALCAEIEREFLSIRTREGIAVARERGKQIGRPRGPANTVALDSHSIAIYAWLAKGISKASIARLLECSPSTLYLWLARDRARRHA